MSILNATHLKKYYGKDEMLEPGGIDHLESDRNSQFELNRNSQCTLAN